MIQFDHYVDHVGTIVFDAGPVMNVYPTQRVDKCHSFVVNQEMPAWAEGLYLCRSQSE